MAKAKMIYAGVFLIAVLLGAAALPLLVKAVLSPGGGPARAVKPGAADTRGVPAGLEDALRSHVETLAGRIGERNFYAPDRLAAAAEYIEAFWRGLGFHAELQDYTDHGRTFRNLWVEIEGKTKPDEIVLAGAHYDSVAGSPGADDNASGVGALLELSRLLKVSGGAARSIRFAAFSNEEPPFFESEGMGSAVYARGARERGEKIAAMLSLESIGYFSDKRGSQHYPPFLGMIYPDTGNFLGVVGDTGSRKLVARVATYARETGLLPFESVAAPRSVPGVSWSDHASFWRHGYPAVMITDTVPYRNPHYHQASDLPETLDYGSYARGTAALAHVIRRLADETL